MNPSNPSSAYFDRVATDWDAISAGYFGSAIREAALAKAYLRSEWAVADIGAGTGYIAAGLAPLVRQVYVVDGSEAMLDVARKNLSSFTNVEYHFADGLALPFPDDSLDAIFANMYLHHTPDPQAAIQEMVRALRPGGRLVITDMSAHPYAWLKDEMSDVWQGFAREDIFAWFEQAGLVNRIVDRGSLTCSATSTQVTHAAPDGSPVKIDVFVATATKRIVMRRAVQRNYTATALGNASCCAPSTDSAASDCCAPGQACCSDSPTQSVEFDTGYTPVELSSVPQEAADISLGCGNPLALANLKPGEVVLDIGSGGGLDAFLAANKVGPTGQVIGVDMTPAMLKRARSAARNNHITNVTFRQGYAEELPVDDNTVDVILSNCVINLTEDKGRVFAEALRVLKPGGRLEVSDVVTAASMPAEAQVNDLGWSECITSALPEAEYLDLIAQAGFVNVTTRRSASSGDAYGVPVYSAIVSAQKPL